MTDSYRKRENAGPPHKEIKLEEAKSKWGNKIKPNKKTPKEFRIQCRRCGYLMGTIVVTERWSREYIIALSKKFGTKWPICKGCKEKKND